MNNSSEKKPMSTLKKSLLVGGGALGLAAGGAALSKGKKLRIGTPLSKSKVVKYMPQKTRQVVGRVVEMGNKLDAILRQFAAIDTAQEPWSYSGCCDSDMPKKPNFPSLYISRSKDAGLMKMQGEGKAVVSYRVTSRNVDESKDDGIPLYGANIEVRSIEAIPGSDEDEEELSDTLFLRELAGGYVNTDEGVKKESGKGAHLKRNAGKYIGGVLAPGSLGITLAGGYLVDKHRKKKNIAATGELEKKQPWKAKGEVVSKKDLSSTIFLRHFAVARDRDGEGRFASGNIPSPDDYAIANQASRKKKVAAGLGAGAVLTGAALGTGTASGRRVAGSIGKGAARAASRLFSAH